MICLELADIAFSGSSRFSTPRPEDAIAVSATGSVLLCQLYSEQLQNHALLKGSSVSFVVLAVGCLAESRSMGGFTSSVWLFALSGVLLATLSLLISARAAKHAVTIAIAARAELLTPSNTQKNPAGAEPAQCGKV